MSPLIINRTISHKTLNSQELSSFCHQLTLILKSGITLNEGLSIIASEYKNSQSGELVSFLSSKMDEGESLSLALNQSGVFPNYMINMVEIGEQSGRLDDVLDSLCNYYERDNSIKSSIKSAILYPSIMIVMMMSIVGILVVKVLPVFNKVYIQLGGELSPFSKSLISIGDGFSRYSLVTICVLGLLLITTIFLYFTKYGIKYLHNFAERFFVTKKICYKLASAKFAMALSLMLSSGMDINSTLRLSLNLINNSSVNSKVQYCLDLVEQGETFADSIIKSELFTPMESKMVSVGFKTGTSDEVIDNLAQKHAQKIDEDIIKLISIIEPTLVAILSIVVGLILLSVMLPLMGIMSSM